tara:strand:- start:157 stop:432 length:276 start_codon:yes stop_codon:yes gene_type:complete
MDKDGKLFSLDRQPFKYDELPDGAILHSGMKVEWQGETFKLDTKPCPKCLRTEYGMLTRDDGTTVCFVCGEVGLMIDVTGRAIRARSRCHQ